jgi:hypothetical protein
MAKGDRKRALGEVTDNCERDDVQTGVHGSTSSPRTEVSCIHRAGFLLPIHESQISNLDSFPKSSPRQLALSARHLASKQLFLRHDVVRSDDSQHL